MPSATPDSRGLRTDRPRAPSALRFRASTWECSRARPHRSSYVAATNSPSAPLDHRTVIGRRSRLNGVATVRSRSISAGRPCTSAWITGPGTPSSSDSYNHCRRAAHYMPYCATPQSGRLLPASKTSPYGASKPANARRVSAV